MIVIREAVSDDLDILLALGSRMQTESIYPVPPIDREWAREYLSTAVSNPDMLLILIAEDKGVPIGFMVAVAGPYAFSPTLRVASDLLFVLPDYRGTVAARKLIRWFMEWAGDRDTTLSVASGIHTERTGKFFERMGFKPTGMTYQRDC